ncbi:MAG TPA: amidohydrolase family protein [Jatrophihabitans sp.]|nr:amidohydrolase family protein [Jatrophihabitans sp.]
MTELDLAITRARIDSAGELRNIGVRAGRIVAITSADEPLGAARAVLEADGRWTIPGAIDTHSHVGELAPEYSHVPGLSREANFDYETRAAIAGGVTTILNYAKFGQGSMVQAFEDGLQVAAPQTRVNVLFHGYIMNEDQLREVPRAVAAGARTFKMFMPYRGAEATALGGIGSLNHSQLERAFQAIAAHGCQALVHAEDGDIVEYCTHEQVATGMRSLASYEQSRPARAEGDAALSAIYLAEQSNCPVTIVHVSSMEAIRARHAVGYANVTLESCPHYLLLSTDSEIGPQGKVAPPIRGPELAARLSDAMVAGEFDFFGSDHNVWPSEAKQDFVSGRAGLPGLGLLLPLLLTHMVDDRGLSMERAVAMTSRNAALRFGLPGKGIVAVGADADLVVLDAGPHTVRASDLPSAVDYSPYEGMKLGYWPAATICGGRLVHHDGNLVDEQFRGEMLNLRYRRGAEQ